MQGGEPRTNLGEPPLEFSLPHSGVTEIRWEGSEIVLRHEAKGEVMRRAISDIHSLKVEGTEGDDKLVLIEPETGFPMFGEDGEIPFIHFDALEGDDWIIM